MMKWTTVAQIGTATWLLVLACRPVPSGVGVTTPAFEPNEQPVNSEQMVTRPVPAVTEPDAAASSMSTISPANDAAPASSKVDDVDLRWGSVQPDAFFSPTLERQVAYLTYFPPGYDASAQRYPVVYVLHGNEGAPEAWAVDALLDWVDDLIRRAAIEPLIIVLPQVDDSSWVSLADGGPVYEDGLAGDLIEHISVTYRVLPGAEHHIVSRLSMGGTGG